MEIEFSKQAGKIVIGKEDRFVYDIDDSCISCGSCEVNCPVQAISRGDGKYEIDRTKCIDCGTCSSVCPVGAAKRIDAERESINLKDIDFSKCYFNPGCALSLYKPEVPELMMNLLKEYYGNIQFHNICCRHNPNLEAGSTIINNCAGCDRRFRSLYEGINTISYWEVIDSIPDLKMPQYDGLKVSIHDSCGYRHKPQVHKAVRSLLKKMNIEIVEAEFSGTESICCGDNFYGAVPNEKVEGKIKMRADQMACDDVVVYCIGCVRAMFSGGKRPRYLQDLLFARETEPMPDTLDEYHNSLENYIEEH